MKEEETGTKGLIQPAQAESGATKRWLVGFLVEFEADNEQDALAISDRLGVRIEEHPSVVGCEDTPIRKANRD